MSPTANRPLKTAIIGASVRGGWARESHVPAVQALDGYELTAVGALDQESADRAAEAFGAARGYGDPAQLFDDAEIDVVTVGVRVPAHRELVLGAVAAGKHVVTEWPLGRDVDEARELRAVAAEAGVHAVIGLQARMSPAVVRARELIAQGAVGRILDLRLYDSTVAFGPTTTAGDEYLEDAANGATHIAIHGGHSLDLAALLVGDLELTSVLASIRHPRVGVDDARTLTRTVPDHLLVQARSPEGAPLNVEVAGGRPATDTPFCLHLAGTDGHIALLGGALRGFQSGRLRLVLNGEEQAVEDMPDLSDQARNVAGLYRALRDDIASGSRQAPGFDDAVALTELIAAVDASGAELTNSASNWLSVGQGLRSSSRPARGQ